MRKLGVLLGAVALLVWVPQLPVRLTASTATPTADPPNIIFIMTDDQAWHTMQFMPHTNQLLGDQGVRFSNSFATTPLCCPSRATHMTGLYSHNHNVLHNEPPWGSVTKFDDSSTLPIWLQAAGYRTGLFGKYINAYGLVAPYVPPGWDEWNAMKAIGTDGGYYDFSLVENGTTVDYSNGQRYSIDVLKNKLVQFIETTPVDQPLYAHFSPTAPHQPAHPATEDAGTFSDLPPYRPPSYNEADVSDKPRWVRDLPQLTAEQQAENDALYRRQVETLQSVDRAVADIVAALEQTDRLDNTVIIFTSDNGWSLGAHRWLKKEAVYEDSIRVPLLVRAPGVAPRVDDNLLLNVDVPAAIVEWAGVTPPYPLDGASFVGLLRDPLTPWRDVALLEYLGRPITDNVNYQAVRTHDFVYAEYLNGDRELYDLASDPHQLTNVVNSAAYLTTTASLDATLDTFRVPTDLAVVGSTSALTATAGSVVTYTYTLTNHGPAHGGNVTLSYNVPAEMQYLSCSATYNGKCVSAPGNGSRQAFFISLANGDSATVRVSMKLRDTVAPGTTVRNTATIGGFANHELTPTDNTATLAIAVANTAQQPLAQDSFSRNVSGGWGSADVGGAYTLKGSTSAFRTVNGVGVIVLPRANQSRSATLPDVAAQNIEAQVSVQTDKLPQGDTQRAAIALRATASDEYRAELRITPAGKVQLLALRASDGKVATLSPKVSLQGITLTPGQTVYLRAQALGSYPTIIRMRAWADGQSEPTTWQYTASDSTASLQTSGAVGLRASLSTGTTNAPVQFRFDNLLVTTQ